MKREYAEKYPYGKPIIRTMRLYRYKFLAIDESRKKPIYLSYITPKDIKTEALQIEYLTSLYPSIKVHKMLNKVCFSDTRKVAAKVFFDNSRTIKEFKEEEKNGKREK